MIFFIPSWNLKFCNEGQLMWHSRGAFSCSSLLSVFASTASLQILVVDIVFPVPGLPHTYKIGLLLDPIPSLLAPFDSITASTKLWMRAMDLRSCPCATISFFRSLLMQALIFSALVVPGSSTSSMMASSLISGCFGTAVSSEPMPRFSTGVSRVPLGVDRWISVSLPPGFESVESAVVGKLSETSPGFFFHHSFQHVFQRPFDCSCPRFLPR
mmetsp:Transcript_104692/g.213519  ORF Transcript_104692/g.213519 Transcript_104692/m.213519 type:complete len:213 (-) Transcript_104692:704-1342(-)